MSATTKSEGKKLKVVGTRPLRPDGVPKVTGLARFGADFSLPGMLWGKVLRSPHAHARIRAIDTSKAQAVTDRTVPTMWRSTRPCSRGARAGDQCWFSGCAMTNSPGRHTDPLW